MDKEKVIEELKKELQNSCDKINDLESENEILKARIDNLQGSVMKLSVKNDLLVAMLEGVVRNG